MDQGGNTYISRSFITSCSNNHMNYSDSGGKFAMYHLIIAAFVLDTWVCKTGKKVVCRGAQWKHIRLAIEMSSVRIHMRCLN